MHFQSYGPLALSVVCWLIAGPAQAELIGYNSEAAGVVIEKIVRLPRQDIDVWVGHLKRSSEAARKTQREFENELISSIACEPRRAASTESIRLNRAKGWYASRDAAKIAMNIISFQTPSGGWEKGIKMGERARQPGELFTAESDIEDNVRPYRSIASPTRSARG